MNICTKCRKIKERNCECPKPKPFENIDRSNYALYNSSKWRKFALKYKKKNPLCVECQKLGMVKQADVLDHIKPILQGGEVYDLDNLQGLCHTHHNQKSAKDRWKYK